MCPQYGLVFAVFDTVGLSSSKLNRLLKDNAEWAYLEQPLWLASTVENFSSLDGDIDEGTRVPLDDDWRSVWIGSTIEDITNFLNSLPESHVRLDRKHFIVIDETLQTQGAIWCYRNKDWGNDDELEDYEAAQLGRRGVTRFAVPASQAAGTLFPMLSMDWENRLLEGEDPLPPLHEDRDWWDREADAGGQGA